MDIQFNKSDRYEDRGNFFPDIDALNKLSAKAMKSYPEEKVKDQSSPSSSEE